MLRALMTSMPITDIHDGIPATLHGLRGLTLDAASVMHRAAFKGTRASFADVPVTEHSLKLSRGSSVGVNRLELSLKPVPAWAWAKAR